MTWDAMLDSEARSVNPAEAAARWWSAHGAFGTGKYIKWSFRDAVEWVVARQLEWGDLSERVAIDELRKGPKSIFYPLFREDPTIWADCPRDGRVTVGVEGYCDSCGFPFDGMPPIREDEK